MLLTSLKLRYKREKSVLKSKQELMTKPYSTTNVWGKIFSWSFKISILTFFSLLIILPFYFMIEQSLVDPKFYEDQGFKIAWWPFDHAKYIQAGKEFRGFLGTSLNWSNFSKSIKEGYLQSLVFTAGFTSVSVVVRLFFAISLGYALSMRNWRGKQAFFGMLLSLMVIPEITLISLQYTLVSKAGWIGQKNPLIIVSMIVPFATSIFNAYMYKNAFEAIPNSVKESSMLDGASGLKYFFNIALPMVKATTWTVIILTALASWNSYTWPALLWDSAPGETSGYYAPINLWLFTTGKHEVAPGQIQTILSVRMAATLLAVIPMIVVYFILRKRIMAAISRQGNATKG
ncbi:carbohydrate ABC transporter permease [Mycoplasmopsis arginini]|uniref:Carbohydrate ABC transporter permease n=2 Tax=Mycoplasmopsis TaxID=2767358 RepID=A0AA43R1F4_MYCAR|nr:carbohydrate ABC transporter permease [Mycoplasmopsis arginini]ENY69844.1 ABC transporter permease protein [Mycoplasmopsis arginini 7264]MDI3348534.1 carbohydrate ABC transporter permease [Mycoplasmopsis arginini]MDI3349161.1 carbohydrate ABC transporter permease [Mycoplasmopsis arginini]MDI3349737.1 carbohydrate ABC transporter permease [Mycoplasmopsis arginini]MDI3351455.1 carbohydrate ABC transporter permease [Mycoplasmopsis arginini]